MTKSELIELLNDARATLSKAFFADYRYQNKADDICDKITDFFKSLEKGDKK